MSEKICEETEFKTLTIKNVNFSKLYSRYCVGVKEEKGKIILDHVDYTYLNNKFGTDMGKWRGKQIEADKNFSLLHV